MARELVGQNPGSVHPLQRALQHRGGVARRRDLLRAGVSRRGLLRAIADGAVRELAPHVLALPCGVDDELLRVAAAGLDGVVSHQAAARRWGLELVEGSEERHVTVERARSRRRWRGAVVHRADLRPGELEVRDGLRVTSVVRTLFDLCRSLPLAEAVAVVDSALRRGRTTTEELVGALADLPRAPGRSLVSRVLAHIDPASGSVLESLLRVLLTLAGLAPPATQHHVRDGAGRLVGRVDFAWPEVRLVVEADGFAFHADRAGYRADRRRGNALVLAGWRVLRFSWEDVLSSPDTVVAQVRAALPRG